MGCGSHCLVVGSLDNFCPGLIYPLNDGLPSESSPIRDITNTDSRTPIIEVNQPVELHGPFEFRNGI